jgi:hypothetical protein
MNVIALDDGGPSWMIGPSVDSGVLVKLREAGKVLEQLASSVGGRAGWDGGGLEWHRNFDGRTALLGFVETDEDATS